MESRYLFTEFKNAHGYFTEKSLLFAVC